MSDQNPSSGLQGTRLPPIKKNGAIMLSKEYRDKILAAVNALFNLEVIVPSTDGSNIQGSQKAEIDISELSMRITMPPNTPSGGGLSALFPWQTPKKELDYTVAVAQWAFVYVSPGNTLHTTGLFDQVSGNNITSASGIWQAVKNVPAAVSNPSGRPAGTYYNVPQLPYPGATGTPSGSPLAGDLDGANVFWVFWGQSPNC